MLSHMGCDILVLLELLLGLGNVCHRQLIPFYGLDAAGELPVNEWNGNMAPSRDGEANSEGSTCDIVHAFGDMVGPDQWLEQYLAW